MVNIADNLSRLLQERSYGKIVTKLLQAAVENGKFDPVIRKDILHNNLFAFKWTYIGDALDAVIDYAEILLEDDILTQDEWKSIRLLRIYLNVEEGDFLKYKREKRIKTLLSSQLKKLYADNRVDRRGALIIRKMQGLFGLSSALYEKYVEEIMQDAIKNGAKRVDLIKNT